MRTRSRQAGTAWTVAGVALIGAIVGACAGGDIAGPAAPAARADAGRAQPTFDLEAINVPGATLTTAQGINAAGHVVGWYATADGRLHGFLLRAGQFTTIDHDGSFFTDARGIGPNDEIVGTFAGANEPLVAFHGYRLTPQGQFKDVHFPGHLYEILQRVLPDGTILGCRHDHDQMGSMKGVTIARSDTSEIAAFASMENGATPDMSRVVGLYINTAAGNRQEGFVIDNGVWRPLLVPGSSLTTAWDVNPRGDIVGVFRNAAGVHGYVLTDQGYTTVDFPGASATRIFGTNARGDIVGAYIAGGHTHGFVGMRVN